MGGMISFMNTFFVASILICCLLVLMLIYNFRQRLNTLETNYKLTLDMLNNVVQKMAMIENGASGGYETQELNVPYMDVNEHQYQEIEGEESEGEESEGEESEGEESEGEESESEGEESEGEESEGEESQGEYDSKVFPETVMIAESKNEIGLDELEDIEDDNTISTEDGKEMALTLENEGELNYEKMNLTQLRALVKTRGLASSVSKMKKADALSLLTA
jgi:hypothetical protein